MRRPTLFLLALGACFPGEAIAAGGTGDGGSARELIWLAVNLSILIGVLVIFARRPVVAHAERRRQQIEAELAGAREELEAAERKLVDWQSSVAELDTELEGIREAVRAQAESEAERILEESRAAAERIRIAADLSIERELRAAKSELRRELAERAMDLAEELLERHVDADDRGRLLNEFLDRVEASGNAAVSGATPAAPQS